MAQLRDVARGQGLHGSQGDMRDLVRRSASGIGGASYKSGEVFRPNHPPPTMVSARGMDLETGNAGYLTDLERS